MIGNSGHIKLAGDGFLELGEERLKSLIRTEPITDVYHVEQTPFARGKFASVRRLVHRTTGVAYAGKFLRRRRRAQDTTRDVAHEMAVLDLCVTSRRVVRLVEVYETRAEMALVLELATGGELQHLLDSEESGLPEPLARRAMRDTLLGLRDLHRHNVAHLDLKPQNLLVCRDDGDTTPGDSNTGVLSSLALGSVKLCDFGISRLIQPGVEVREIMGTPDYVAPEVLQYEPLSLATDIWSAGVLAYVLLTGCSPFAGDTKQETFLNITRASLEFPEDDEVEMTKRVSDAARDFIASCLRVQPGQRPTVDECLEHPWLAEITKLDSVTNETSILTTATNNTANEIINENGHNNTTNHKISDEDNQIITSNTANTKTANEENDIENQSITENETNQDQNNTIPTLTNEKLNGTVIPTSKSKSKDAVDTKHTKLTVNSLVPTKPQVVAAPVTKTSVYITSFPDAPTTPKVSRKTTHTHSHTHTQNSTVLNLCKKFQSGDTTVKLEKDIKDNKIITADNSIDSNNDKKDTEISGVDGENDNFTNFENSVAAAYTMSCLMCSQCCAVGQCCHMPRKSLSSTMERGIIC